MASFALALAAPATSAPAQALRILASDNIQILLADSTGRKVGYDLASGYVVRDFEECGYELTGVGDIDVPVGQQTTDQAHELWIKGHPYGRFNITVYGDYGGHYSLRITQGYGARSRIVLSNYIFKGTQKEYALFTDAAEQASIERLATSSSIRQDLDNSYKLKLLGDKELYKDLSHRLDKFEKDLARKDSSDARDELKRFGEKIEEVRKETIKREQKKQKPPKHFITADAYQILDEDVNALLKQLPTKKKGKKEKDDDRKDDDREGR